MTPLQPLLRKELTETLRDRRTLLMMLGLPLLLYPALVVLMGQLMVVGKWRLTHMELSVALVGADAPALLGTRVPERTRWVALERHAARDALAARKVDAVLDVPEGALGQVEGSGQAVLKVLYSRVHDASVEARRRVDDVIQTLAKERLQARLNAGNLPGTFAEPVRAEAEDVLLADGWGALIASRLFPLMLVAMLFLGAFYTAIDVTAGEKERGTLETLLVAPVRPLQVMTAKLLTVVLICCAVTLLNLGSLAATLAFGIRAADEGLQAQLALSPRQLALLALLILPCAVLVSSISLSVACLARTYREGQHLLTPLLVAGIVPPVLSLTPGLELGLWNAWIPLFNVALLIKGVILGTANAVDAAVVVTSSVVVAAAGLWLAANAFQSEALRFGGVESWRDLFRPGP